MDIPAWLAATVAAIGSFIGFLGGLFGDLLKRVIPTYTDLINEVNELRKDRRAQDDTIDGLRDALIDDKEDDN